jgi:NADH-quinone oxidoreductase subunit J
MGVLGAVLPGLLAVTSKVDVLVFVAAAVIVLAGALGVILARNPVHSALMLVMTLFGIAILFIAQEAHFLAAVQVIVYAGAIVVLFLFVIMLLGVDRQESLEADPLRNQRPFAIALGMVAFAEVIILGGTANWTTGNLATAGQAGGPGTNVEKLARSIFTRYLLAFEITSALLVIAVIGAVVLARKLKPVPPADSEAGQ